MKKHLYDFAWLWLTVLCVLFAFPHYEWAKVDSALYATLARNIVESGSWWPLHLSNDMFPNFQEHPPLPIWVMALFVKCFGASFWVAALFSRICSFFAVFAAAWALNKYLARSKISETQRPSLVALCIVLTLTWIPWVKFAGSAQYEGPLSLALVALVGLCMAASAPDKRRSLAMPFFLIGLLGMHIKGIIFLSPLLFVLLWAFAKKFQTIRLRECAALAAGFITAALSLWLLDKLSGTQWTHYYWLRALGWGLQGENLYNASQEIPLLNLAQRSLDTLRMELSKSPLWTPFIWVLTIRVFWRNLKAKTLDFSLFLTLFYWSFMAPFMISKIKMPHWPVPIYPVAALLISLELAVSAKVLKLPIIRYQKYIFVLCALFLALAPLKKKPAFGRGEEFAYHQFVVKSSSTPLLFVTDKYHTFYAQTYAAWYFGPNKKINYISSEQFPNNPCEQELLWLHPELSESFKNQLEVAGWHKSLHQTAGVDLYQCENSKTSK